MIWAYRSLNISARLVARDLGNAQAVVDPSAVFDLGASGGSDVARNKNAMIGEAFAARRKKSRRA